MARYTIDLTRGAGRSLRAVKDEAMRAVKEEATRDYTVDLKPAAVRALKKIKDQPLLRRLAHAIDGLAAQPRPPGVKRLEGEPGVFRIRVGDYRILYTIEDAVLTVLVVRIGHRREVYR